MTFWWDLAERKMTWSFTLKGKQHKHYQLIEKKKNFQKLFANYKSDHY